MGRQTLENPWSLVYENHPKALGVVCLETFDHELDRGVVLGDVRSLDYIVKFL